MSVLLEASFKIGAIYHFNSLQNNVSSDDESEEAKDANECRKPSQQSALGWVSGGSTPEFEGGSWTAG